ncbi:hypothetical protein LNL84_10560 [Vibrio sp. ZSDZ34]|uniref:Nitrate/nitrite sensing protein domain-containing protein n=1 Tax=Vibrio gelatinilyticus TaxID=2893468 RepID=A0A9X1WBN2_9VIBR|nr:hypothetical protein [Vibrio gelatinilyticus]MCJ2377269.1 hypothetical protein [Vibrio gelatinilyticus]
MFVFISLAVALCTLLGLSYAAKKHSSQHEHRYQLIVALRDIIEVTRQHRNAAHYTLMFGQDKSRHITLTQQRLTKMSSDLIELAPFDNKPMYRILEQNIKQLLGRWSQLNVSRSQIAHGKIIRHSLLLIDDLVVDWIANQYSDALDIEYSQTWQGVFDCLDALTQLRLCIDYIDNEKGDSRLVRRMETLQKKLIRLSVNTPTRVPSPTSSLAMTTLEQYIENPTTIRSKEDMYQLTTTLSEVIFLIYDTTINEVIQELYQPLPKTALA